MHDNKKGAAVGSSPEHYSVRFFLSFKDSMICSLRLTGSSTIGGTSETVNPGAEFADPVDGIFVIEETVLLVQFSFRTAGKIAFYLIPDICLVVEANFYVFRLPGEAVSPYEELRFSIRETSPPRLLCDPAIIRECGQGGESGFVPLWIREDTVEILIFIIRDL